MANTATPHLVVAPAIDQGVADVVVPPVQVGERFDGAPGLQVAGHAH